MRTMLYAVVLASLLAPQPGSGPRAAETHRHELWVGFGGGVSSEKGIFNVPDDLASKPEVLISLGYLFSLDARNAIGLHVYGGAETTPEAFLVPPDGTTPVPVKFDLDTFNMGVRLRHTFTSGTFQPYAWVGLSLATGTLSSPETGDLDYSGFSAGAGPGVLVALGRHFTLAVEGIASFGTANWKTEPFANSDGKQFDPGLLGATANLGFGWGRVPQ